MKYCCPSFEDLISQVGIRGLSAIAVKRGDARFYALQIRGIDKDKLDQLQLSTDIPKGDYKILIETQIGIQFCPWCGSQLERKLLRQAEEFDRLAAKHKSYCMDN